MSDVHKVKELLVEIMLKPNWKDEYEDYKWNAKYKMHMTLAGVLHTKRLVKYGEGGSHVYPNYVITNKGREFLNKGENNEQ
jgi:hypothetical protein